MTDLSDDGRFERQADLCQVLCNAKRLRLLAAIDDGERTVGELVEATGAAQPTVSQHLRLMLDRGVVTRRSEGTRRYYSVTDERLLEATRLTRAVVDDMDRPEARTD